MALAHVICVLLAGQALGASVIRSEAVMDVDASTAEDILAQVEDMAKHHAKMDKPKIETIQELTTQLETALSDTHQSAQKQVEKNLVAIQKCNEDKAATFSKIAATTKKTVEAERKAHETCRDEEVETHVDMVKKCKHLKSWLKSLTSPEKTGEDDAAKVEWVGKMDSYWCPKGDKAKEKSKICKKAKADHKAAKEKCDPLQTQFELGFCTWRVELIDACGAHTTCYDDALKAYKDHKADTEQLIVKWKIEYVALKKISCYVNVWLSDDNADTVDADQLTECQELQPDKSKMNIDFKSPVAKAECSLAEVAKYPGTDAFKQTEYKKFLDIKETIGDDKLSHFINEPTACDDIETPTAAPEVHTTQSCTKKQAKNERICKRCSTGKACGDTCISAEETCHVDYGCACNEEKAPTSTPTEAPTKAPKGTLVTCKLTIDNYLTGVKYNGKTLTTTYVADGKVYKYASNSETNPHKDHHWYKAKSFSFNDAGAGVDLDISGFEHDRVGSFHGCRASGLALECTAADPASKWNKYGSDLSTWAAKGADTPSGLAKATFAKPCETTSGFHLTGAKGFHKEIWPRNGKRYAEFSGSPYGDRESGY